MEFLSGDDLDVQSKMDVVTSVISWVGFDEERRGDFILDLLKSIRFQHLKPKVGFIRNSISRQELIDNFIFSRSLAWVKSAWSSTAACPLDYFLNRRCNARSRSTSLPLKEPKMAISLWALSDLTDGETNDQQRSAFRDAALDQWVFSWEMKSSSLDTMRAKTR